MQQAARCGAFCDMKQRESVTCSGTGLSCMGDLACCRFSSAGVALLDSCCPILPLLCELYTLFFDGVFQGKLFNYLFNKHNPGKFILFNFEVKLPQKEAEISFHSGTPCLKIDLRLALAHNKSSKRSFTKAVLLFRRMLQNTLKFMQCWYQSLLIQ